MRPTLTLAAAPTGDVVTRAEAKAHLRVIAAQEDTLIDALIAAAVERFDAARGILGRALLTQDWALAFSGAQVAALRRRLPLPFPPVQSIVSVGYYDADNASQTFAAANYALAADEDSAALVLGSSASWPSVYDREGALTVTIRCGYGAAADVPERLKQAILADVASMFRVRESLGAPLSRSPFYTDTVAAFTVAEGLT